MCLSLIPLLEHFLILDCTIQPLNKDIFGLACILFSLLLLLSFRSLFFYECIKRKSGSGESEVRGARKSGGGRKGILHVLIV